MNEQKLLRRKSMLLAGVFYVVFVNILWTQIRGLIGFGRLISVLTNGGFILNIIGMGLSAGVNFALGMFFAIWMPCKILKIKVDMEQSAFMVICVYALETIWNSGVMNSLSVIVRNPMFSGLLFSMSSFMFAALANDFSLNPKKDNAFGVKTSVCVFAFALGVLGNVFQLLLKSDLPLWAIQANYPTIPLMFCSYLIYKMIKGKRKQQKLLKKAKTPAMVALALLAVLLSISPAAAYHNEYENKLTDIQQVYNEDGSEKYNKDGSKKLKRVYERTESKVKGTSAGAAVLLLAFELAGSWYACVAIREIYLTEK